MRLRPAPFARWFCSPELSRRNRSHIYALISRHIDEAVNKMAVDGATPSEPLDFAHGSGRGTA